MLQSHYIPLEEPYRIIYAGGVMGLQIGTLLVVHDLGPSPRGGRITPAISRFITQSYPVVSYTNKSMDHIITDIGQSGLFNEGVVWDHVTQDQVATICLEGQQLPWEDCLDFMGPEQIPPYKEKSLSDEIQRSYRNLKTFCLLGGRISVPEAKQKRHSKDYSKHCQTIEIELEHDFYTDENGKECPCFRSILGAEIFFFTNAQDLNEAFAQLDQQRNFYQSVIGLYGAEYKIGKIHFISGNSDAKLSRLVKKLNKFIDENFPNG